MELSEMNVKQYKVDKLKQAEKLNPEQRSTRLLKEIQETLHLPKLPAHIECFDNSNIQGSDAVAACVVFKMAKPSKKDYRKYNIKTVVGPDDYASMKEVVRRRYQRAIVEETPLPDLIITDGGKGQMEVVREVIQDELHLDIPIAGLAKDGNTGLRNSCSASLPKRSACRYKVSCSNSSRKYRTRCIVSPSLSIRISAAKARQNPNWIR